MERTSEITDSGHPRRHRGRRHGRGSRGRRGDVRAAILILLAEEPMHGYQLIRQIAERSHRVWKPSPGSIYPALAQLENEGLIFIEPIDGRKTARLSEVGKRYVADNETELGDPFGEATEGVSADIRSLQACVQTVIGAAGQVAAIGTAEQLDMAAEILVDARKRLFRLLAEDSDESLKKTSVAPRGNDEQRAGNGANGKLDRG